MSLTENGDSKVIVEDELLQHEVSPNGWAFWVLVLAGIVLNWVGGFVRYRAHQSLFSTEVLREALFFFVISVLISAFVGRKNWRWGVAVFPYISIGVAGFFCIGAR